MGAGLGLTPEGHVPVLYSEVLENLALGPGDHVIDGTVGGGATPPVFYRPPRPMGVCWDWIVILKQ